MEKHRVYKRGAPAGEVAFNMTPLIDCTFQLIIFFILASQIASRSLANVSLHRPVESQAIPSDKMETPNRVIVNVISAESDEDAGLALTGRAKEYEIDGRGIAVEDTERLTDILRKRKQASEAKDFCVEIRADFRVDFGDVQPVMLAAAEARIVKMNITALTAKSQ